MPSKPVRKKVTSPDALARVAKRGYERSKKGRTEFLAGTFEVAPALSKARKKLPSDQAFHDWIIKAGLRDMSKDDRAALIIIGSNVKAARKYFRENPDAWSWRLCAQSVSQPAKPTASRVLNIPVRMETRTIVAPVYSKKVEEAPPVVIRPSYGATVEEEPHQTGVVAAVQAMIDAASSTTTAAVAAYWRTRSAEHLPSSDQVREAAQWLDMLANALDIDQHKQLSH
ncbi:hypothetical protein EI171_20435 [Bradyrhizobium sp. LCT2]|uniref:hypothetical protein n=1 Tax=Bradyrhizobium sp. LCT2 TaxID=2493093 RepID=UPI0013742828|nr:hypothetical protein [Bradyrhizobium sp. LCT2]QHP69444.1 hypothetical protein EI171_20435 [Bradyrhizobium sp. LCT2]